MEQSPEKPPQPVVPKVDVEKQATEYVQGLRDTKTREVDYTKVRPLEKPQESPEIVSDKKLRALSFHMSKVPGEKRTAFKIYQDLKAQEKKQKEN
jgi:hypothetical protein